MFLDASLSFDYAKCILWGSKVSYFTNVINCTDNMSIAGASCLGEALKLNTALKFLELSYSYNWFVSESEGCKFWANILPCRQSCWSCTTASFMWCLNFEYGSTNNSPQRFVWLIDIRIANDAIFGNGLFVANGFGHKEAHETLRFAVMPDNSLLR